MVTVKLLGMFSEDFDPSWQHDAVLRRPRENDGSLRRRDQTSSGHRRSPRTGRKYREIFLDRSKDSKIGPGYGLQGLLGYGSNARAPKTAYSTGGQLAKCRSRIRLRRSNV